MPLPVEDDPGDPPMLVENSRVSLLSNDDRQVVESWIVNFDRHWHEGRLATQLDEIPPDSSLRLPALAEMVKIDLERRWRSGQQISLESYLGQFPELGGPGNVSADLILAEYEIRRQFGVPVSLEDYLRRFPHQASELGRLIAQGGSALSVPPSAPNPPANPTILWTPPKPPEPLTERFGRYQILRRLGQGGMGAVYLAEDTQLGRHVALKVPDFGQDDGPEARRRFLEEARTAATLDHPYLCPVYDVGEVEGRLYLTMAYIEGKSLAEVIRAQGMPSRQVAALVGKLAQAMQTAHDKKVVHRDLKPANVMIRTNGAKREPVIVDFGLARRDDPNDARLTRTGQVMGTLGYMAPEQIRGDLNEIGPACDIYAMGVILYELLTGQLPFRGTGLAVAGQILTQDPLVPSVHRPDLDPRLEAICLKAMAKKAANRYQSMRELAEALTTYLREPSARSTVPASSPGREAAGLSRQTGPDSLVAQLFQGLSVEDASEGDAPSLIRDRSKPAGGPPSGGPRLPWALSAAAGAAGAVVLGIIITITLDKNRASIEIAKTPASTHEADLATNKKTSVAPLTGTAKGPVGGSGSTATGKIEPSKSPKANAPADALLFKEHVYKVFNEKLQWREARKKCEEMGGTLAMIKAEDENRFVRSLVVKAGLETAWLGATDEKEEGRWLWLDGSPMVYNAWDKGWAQPNNEGGANGVGEDHLAMDVARGGVWWDYSEGDFKERWPGYVCQWPLSPVMADARPFQGARYKVFNEKISWHDARKKCEALGGTLAIVKNDDVNRYISSLVSASGLDSAWLGATDEKVEGRWVWLDGSEMVFNVWDSAASQPNNHGPGDVVEHYLVTVAFRGGAWWDYPDFCLTQLHPGYVCQWGPATPQ
jgi:serine/threonine protein kinase